MAPNILGRLLGESDTDTEGRPEEPSHVCQSCGEEYYTDPQVAIPTCRECGGVRVEPQ